jgi:hypothetical protein
LSGPATSTGTGNPSTVTMVEGIRSRYSDPPHWWADFPGL